MKDSQKTKPLTITGFILTTIWVSIVCYLWGTNKQSIFTLDLNNLGDFLAGAVAPLAVLWFIIGYFQQGKELKQNTEALLLQQRELENQVKETRALVEQTSQQAKIMEDERNLAFEEKRPKLVCIDFHDKMKHEVNPNVSIIFINIGGPALHFWALCDVSTKYSANFKLLRKDNPSEPKKIYFEFPINTGFPIKVNFGYETILGEKFKFESNVVEGKEKMQDFFSVPPTNVIRPKNPFHQSTGSGNPLGGDFFKSPPSPSEII